MITWLRWRNPDKKVLMFFLSVFLVNKLLCTSSFAWGIYMYPDHPHPSALPNFLFASSADRNANHEQL